MDELNEGVQVEQVVSCLLCGEAGEMLYANLRDPLLEAPGLWNNLRCPNCGLVWLNPRPNKRDIGKVYADYYTHCIEVREPNRRSLLERIKRMLLAVDFGYGHLIKPHDRLTRLAARLFGLLPPLREAVRLSAMDLRGPARGKLLEVGCGNGSDLVWMQELGWDVQGVEPDPEAATNAERLGVAVKTGTLEEVPVQDNSFDVIVMHHVIEHVHDPIGLLQECRRVLKPGGDLMLITPNVESLGHRVFRESWLSLEPARHLHLFSPGTLKACTEQAGFRIKTSRTTTRWARWIWPASWRIRRHKGRLADSVTNLSWTLRLGGLGLQLCFYFLHPFSDRIGDEIVLAAFKDQIAPSSS